MIVVDSLGYLGSTFGKSIPVKSIMPQGGIRYLHSEPYERYEIDGDSILTQYINNGKKAGVYAANYVKKYYDERLDPKSLAKPVLPESNSENREASGF
jgi:hypothetical protein